MCQPFKWNVWRELIMHKFRQFCIWNKVVTYFLDVEIEENMNVKCLSWRMPSSCMLRRLALVRPNILEECIASIVRVTIIGEIGTVWHIGLIHSVIRLVVTANVVHTSPILVTLMMEAIVPTKRRFLQEPHNIASQKTAFFIVTTMKTSNLTMFVMI
jgi:hypothetical protein